VEENARDGDENVEKVPGQSTEIEKKAGSRLSDVAGYCRHAVFKQHSMPTIPCHRDHSLHVQ